MSAGVQRVLERIRGTVESGSYYEAQQMYKTVFHRYHSRKMFEDSYKILEEGAVLQLDKGNLTCGVELGLLLIESYDKDNLAVSEIARQIIDNILEHLHSFASSNKTSSRSSNGSEPEPSCEDTILEEALRLYTAAVKWGHKQASGFWIQQLHNRAARFVWCACGWKKFGLASYHYARGNDWQGFAKALGTCIRCGEPSEEDLFIVRSMLQILAWGPKDQTSERITAAQMLIDEYKKERPLPDTPLIHFGQMLLQALKRDSKPLVQVLQSKYGPSLERDPGLTTLLQQVEQDYFGIGHSNGIGGMLGEMMKMFTGGNSSSAENEQN